MLALVAEEQLESAAEDDVDGDRASHRAHNVADRLLEFGCEDMRCPSRPL